MNVAGAPTPCPNPTTIGVLNSMAEIGAEPVTVRNRTPPSPTAPLRSLATSLRWETSKSSGTAAAPGLPPLPPTEVLDCAIDSSPTAGCAGSGRPQARLLVGYVRCGTRHSADGITW